MQQLTRAIVLTSLAAAVAPSVAAGQDSPSGSAQTTAQSPARPAPDFFFGRPRGSMGIRGSWLFARAGSDLFDFVERQLTVDKKDFNTPAFGMDLGIAITPRIDVAVTFDLSQAQKASEYRNFVDNKLLPIEQETMLRQRNLGGSVRYSLLPRGRGVSRYAWVPRAVTPYVGAGAGALWYKFQQNGDFVDFVDLSVFKDYFSSSGWAPSAHAFGGADIRVYRILYLSVEGRYLWANAKLGKDFVDFDPIDLAGFRLSTGLNVVF